MFEAMLVSEGPDLAKFCFSVSPVGQRARSAHPRAGAAGLIDHAALSALAMLTTL